MVNTKGQDPIPKNKVPETVAKSLIANAEFLDPESVPMWHQLDIEYRRELLNHLPKRLVDGEEYPAPPPHVKVLKNGGGLDERTGYIVFPPGSFGPKGKSEITPERAKEMSNTRWNRVREAWAEGMIEAVKKKSLPAASNNVTVLDAVKKVAEAQTELAIDPSKGSASTNAANFILRVAGIYDEQQHQSSQSGSGGVEIKIYGDVAERLLNMLSSNDNGDEDIIDIESY